MATWNGIPKNFILEVYQRGALGHSDYENVEFNWEYGTVSDYLRVIRKDSNGETSESYSNWEAQARLYIMAQWIARYEGREALKTLLKDFLDEE
jgi:hypothetical protein